MTAFAVLCCFGGFGGRKSPVLYTLCNLSLLFLVPGSPRGLRGAKPPDVGAAGGYAARRALAVAFAVAVIAGMGDGGLT